MEPIRIEVKTPSRAYIVTVGDGVLARAGKLLDGVGLPEHRFVVSSPLVWRLHGSQLVRATGSAEPIRVPDGERFKQLQTVMRIYEALIGANADRASTLVTFDGGVVGDRACVRAATQRGGI